MIGGKLKKLAEQYGLKISGGVAYGNLLGYAVTLREDGGCKTILISTVFPDVTLKAQLETFLKQQNLARTYQLQSLKLGPTYIRITFSNVLGIMKKVESFIEWFFPLLGRYGATRFGTCPVCGEPIMEIGQWKLVNDMAVYMHGGCTEQLRQSLGATDGKPKTEEGASYFWGAIGAVLGAILGSILWALILVWGYVASIVGFVIGWLANVGYDKLRGKKGKAKVLILLLAVVIGVAVGYFGYLAYYLVHDYSVPFRQTLSVTLNLLQDREFLGDVMADVFVGLIFAGLGVFSLLHQTGKDVSGNKMTDLP